MKVKAKSANFEKLIRLGQSKSFIGGILLPDYKLVAKDSTLSIEGLSPQKNFWLKTWCPANVEEEGSVNIKDSATLWRSAKVFGDEINISSQGDELVLLSEGNLAFELRQSSKVQTVEDLDVIHEKLDLDNRKFGKKELTAEFVIDVLTAHRVSQQLTNMKAVMTLDVGKEDLNIEVSAIEIGKFLNALPLNKAPAEGFVNKYSVGTDVLLREASGDMKILVGPGSPMFCTTGNYEAFLSPIREGT